MNNEAKNWMAVTLCVWELFEFTIFVYWFFFAIDLWIPGFIQSYFSLLRFENVVLLVGVIWMTILLLDRIVAFHARSKRS